MSVCFEWIDRRIQLRVSAGERLLDAWDEHPQTGTLFGCRSAHCGGCLVRVVDGAELVLAAAADESETLRAIGADSGQRLACQIRAIADGGVVQLESAPTTESADVT